MIARFRQLAATAAVAGLAASFSYAARKPAGSSPTAPTAPRSSVQRVQTPGGVVTVTRTPNATAADLGVSIFPGARVKEAQTWREAPPKGRASLLAIGQFETTSPLATTEQFYRKALGTPEVRRSETKKGTVIVLSRVKWLEPAKPKGKGAASARQSDSIVVRLERSAGAKVTSILIRRAVRGAPVKLEAETKPAPRRTSPTRPPATTY